jgi:hypothetical protein
MTRDPNDHSPIFRTRRTGAKLVSRPCAYCGLPMQHLRPDSDKTEHGWCRGVKPPRGPQAVPAPSRADVVGRGGQAEVAVEVATARFPISSLGGDLPIEPQEVSMPKAEAKVNRLPVQPAPALVEQVAEEYLDLRAELERIEAEMKKRRPFLEEELAKRADLAITIGDEQLVLVPCTSESFDLDAAKAKGKKVGLTAAMLKPYTEVIEKFDLKAARKHLDEKSLTPFIKVKEFIQLRVKPVKEGE